METPLEELVRLLDLAPVGGRGEVWLGDQSAQAAATRHVFGGLVLAQALRAGASTVARGRAVHSLHASFLRAGDHERPIRYEVERSRDGRTLSHRRVTAVQERGPICELLLSFAVTEDEPAAGAHPLEHADVPPSARDALEDGDPTALPRDEEVLADHPEVPPVLRTAGPVDLRYPRHPQVLRDAGQRAHPITAWLRADGDLPDDPVLHACVVAYATDLVPLEPVVARHGSSMRVGDVRPATLDHAVWFHAPVRADRWVLAVLDSPWAGLGRGLGRVALLQDGVPVLHVVQEGLFRPGRRSVDG